MNKVTELQRNNRMAMLTHMITYLVMILLVMAQVVKGEASPAYGIILGLGGAAPVILECVFWSRNRNTGMIKHLTAIGFAVFYNMPVHRGRAHRGRASGIYICDSHGFCGVCLQ